ncbi:MAG: VWA domain-containing protein [Rhodothermales bacterium]|nr:VWA domain-containing protein [Rhodothermales bacterium]
MGLSLGSSLLLLILTLVVLAILSVFVYRKTTPELATPRKVFLVIVRFAAVALVAFLLFRPEYRLTSDDRQEPVVAILIDGSESSKTAATDSNGTSTTNALRDLVAGVERIADVRTYVFDRDARSVDAALDSLSFNGQRTDISRAIEFVGTDLERENLSSIVLVSDGRYNTGPNPVYASEKLAVPVISVIVGDTTALRDIKIARVETNELAYVGVSLPVDVVVQSDGFEGASVSVAIVTESGETLDAADVTLPPSGSELIVPLEIVPRDDGVMSLRGVVTRVRGEQTFRNNSEPFRVRVLESKKRVLLIASRPGPDVATIQKLLRTNADLTVSPYIQKTASRFYTGDFTARPDTFDLAILIGYPSRSANSNILARLSDAVSEGLPLLYVYQRNSDVSTLARAMPGMLPVILESARQGNTPASIVPTSRVEQHAVTKDLDFDVQDIRSLPPLTVSNSRWVLAPGSTKLFTNSIRGVDLEDPMIAVLRRPGFRTAVVLGEGLFLWQNLPEDSSDSDGFLDGLFTNLVTWLTAGTDERLVRVAPVEQLFGGGEQIRITGQIYDESLSPVLDASVELQITGPDGRVLPYMMDNDGGGRYSLEIISLPEGQYSFGATASADDQIIGSDEGGFGVGDLTLEFRDTTADPFLMRQIAARTGGFSRFLSEADSVVQLISTSEMLQERVVTSESRIRLWQRYPFLIVITLLLTAEWFVRKRTGLV